MDAKTALQAKAETSALQSDGKKAMTIKDWIVSMESDIKKALPTVITPERFTRMALTAVNINPKLGECTPKSFMAALMTAAQLGLEPNTPLGQAYLIPYTNSRKNARTGQWEKIPEVQFQIGYKGMIELAHRSGQFQVIQAQAVYSKDVFEYEYGLDAKLIHKPVMTDRGEVIAYYAVYRLVNGGYGFEVMSKPDMDFFRNKYSKAGDKSPWVTNFDAMAKKTVLKQLLKYAPISVEFARDIEEDGAIRSEIDPNMSEVPQENVFDLNADEYESMDETPGGA